jgi:chaperonin cofactor prefoldin
MNSPLPGRTTKDDRGDPKLIATVRTVNMVKASNAIMPEFLKAVQKYHQQLHALNQTSQVLSDLMLKLADVESGDLSDSIRKISDTQKLIDAKRWKFATALQEALVQSYEKSGGGQLDADKSDIATFEKTYKAQKSASMKNIKKFEKEFNKANKKKKKDEDKIKNLANTLEQSVESHDKLLGDELKKVEQLDRRRVCFFIKQWSKVLAEEAEGMEAGLVEIGKVKSELDQFTSDPDKVSGTTDNLIENSRPTKTLDQLKKIRETGYYSESLLNISGMDDDDDDDVGGSTILKGRSVPTYKVRVKQRFDATHPDEMSLTLGDIFDVSEEIDENWAIAEVAGKRGMFPLNHVEKMIMLGASGSRFN